jgi:hypothetical protein
MEHNQSSSLRTRNWLTGSSRPLGIHTTPGRVRALCYARKMPCCNVCGGESRVPAFRNYGGLSIRLGVDVTFGEVRIAPSSLQFTGFDSLASVKSSSSACFAIPPPRALRPDGIDECSHGCYSRFSTHQATSEHATVVANIKRSDTNSPGPWCALHQRHAVCLLM